MANGLLLLDIACLAPAGQPDPAAEVLLTRLALRQVPVIGLGPAHPRLETIFAVPAPHHRQLLDALLHSGADPAQTWVVTRNPGWITPATTAGLAGVVLIGAACPPGEHAIIVTAAEDLADITRVMIPRQGGCWHDPR